MRVADDRVMCERSPWGQTRDRTAVPCFLSWVNSTHWYEVYMGLLRGCPRPCNRAHHDLVLEKITGMDIQVSYEISIVRNDKSTMAGGSVG